MHDLKKKYLRILEIELDDLREDFELLLEQCRHEQESSLLSPYVFLENASVLHREILSLDKVRAVLADINLETYGDIGQLVAALEERFHGLVRSHNLMLAVGDLLCRKLRKVEQYVRDTA